MRIDKYNEVGIPTGILEHTETANMAMTGNATAKPMEECKYPLCEECVHYIGHYCTVPIVISKQIWWMTSERIYRLEKSLAELETLVTDEILGSQTRDGITLHPATKEQEEALNYTLMEYIDDFGEDDEILDV